MSTTDPGTGFSVQSLAAPIGRGLLSLIFLFSGLGKMMDWSGTAGYMAVKGMPLVPFFLFMAIVFEFVGGLSVLLGYRGRLGAAMLIVFLVPTTFIFHNFWAFEGMEQRMQMISFLKNLSIMGGLAFIASVGTGPFSLDRRGQRS